MDAHTILASVMQKCQMASSQAMQQYHQCIYDPAFSMAIHQHNLMPYLAFSQAHHQVKTLHALLYAFRYPGTREAMINLCLALFGSQAVIHLYESPALVDVSISVSNESFFFTLAQEWSLADDGFALADFSLNKLTQNPLRFLQQFAPVGVVIRQLTISIQGNDSPTNSYHFHA